MWVRPIPEIWISLLALYLNPQNAISQMAPHIVTTPDKPSHIFTHPDMLPQAFPSPLRALKSLQATIHAYLCLHIGLRSLGPRPLFPQKRSRFFPKTNGLDNTVGPVPKISGYVFNTLQSNSAAHVPNTNMNPIDEDTHFCDLDLYETIYQSWCIIDNFHSMTPIPDADAFDDASKDLYW